VPRVRGGVDQIDTPGGVRVLGVYQGFLEKERESYCRHGEPFVTDDGDEIRVYWRDRGDHSAGFFVWPRRLLDRLEAGGAVVVPRWKVPRDPVGGRWPWGPNQVVEVSADDVVRPVIGCRGVGRGVAAEDHSRKDD